MWRTILVVALSLISAEARAQSRLAESTVTIERALTISTVRPLTFGRVAANGVPMSSAGSADAVIQVTGDPGRLYRVRLPAAIMTSTPGTTIDSFTIWSDTAGDISQSLTGRIDDRGQDRLRIGGALRRSSAIILSDVTAAIPVSVDYE